KRPGDCYLTSARYGRSSGVSSDGRPRSLVAARVERSCRTVEEVERLGIERNGLPALEQSGVTPAPGGGAEMQRRLRWWGGIADHLSEARRFASQSRTRPVSRNTGNTTLDEAVHHPPCEERRGPCSSTTGISPQVSCG